MASAMPRSPRTPRACLAGPLPLAFAHRGGSLVWPENTLLAFQNAAALGFSHFETDVHLTRDGMLVACHDERLERTTDGSGLIRDHTLAEIKRLDAGCRFSGQGDFPYRGTGCTIPTLTEVIEALPGARFTIEIKPNDPAVVTELLRLIERDDLRDRVIVGSFHLAMLREVRRQSGGAVATSAGPAEALRFWLAARLRCERLLAPAYDALQVPEVRGRLRVVAPRFVAAAHRIGLQVHVWTVNEVADMRRLLGWGVDGIMSDRPDLLREVVPAVQHPA